MARKALFLLTIGVVVAFFSLNLLAQDEQATFAPGDGVQIKIWQLGERSQDLIKNINGEYAIDGYGYIELPMVGPFLVGGKTTNQVARELKKKYADYLENPVILVHRLIRIVLLGEFMRPGAYRIDPRESLWQLIEMAGGPTNQCDLNKMFVVRNDQVTIKELLRAFEKGYSLEEIGVKSGDQIHGPARRHFGLQTILTAANFAVSIALLYIRLKERW